MDANTIAAAGALVAAVFTGLAALIYRRIEWITGSTESFQRLLVRIEIERLNREAEDAGKPERVIDVRWWDPSGRVPKFPGERHHNAQWVLSSAFVGLPFEERQLQPNLWRDSWRLIRWLSQYTLPPCMAPARSHRAKPKD